MLRDYNFVRTSFLVASYSRPRAAYICLWSVLAVVRPVPMVIRGR